MTKRIDYIDGLKFLLSYLVLIAHFMMAFYPEGYIGFGSAYSEAEKLSVLINKLPYSLYINSSFPLYIFIGLISFIITILYYNSNDKTIFLEKQTIKRYFRFVIPVAAASIITFVLYKTGVMHVEDTYKLTGSKWILVSSIPSEEISSVWDLIYISFVDCFFENKYKIISVLWCMPIIFLGSLLTYGFLAIFGNSKKRNFAYLIWALISIPYPEYSVFLSGIICADFYIHKLPEIISSKPKSTKREILSVLLILISIGIGLIPSLILPKPLTIEFIYSIGVILFLLGLMGSTYIQKLLSLKLFVSQSKYSFSVILVQFGVLFTVGYFVFKNLLAWNNNYNISFLITLIVSMLSVHVISVIFHYLFEQPSNKLANFIDKKIEELS